MSFYLKYSNDNFSTSSSLEITDYVRDVVIPTNEKETGVTLRGSHYETTLYSKSKRLISISADFLATDSNYNFMIAFWNAGATQYSPDNINWTDVIVEGGDLPVEFLEGHKGLRDITITLINRDAD